MYPLALLIYNAPTRHKMLQFEIFFPKHEFTNCFFCQVFLFEGMLVFYTNFECISLIHLSNESFEDKRSPSYVIFGYFSGLAYVIFLFTNKVEIIRKKEKKFKLNKINRKKERKGKHIHTSGTQVEHRCHNHHSPISHLPHFYHNCNNNATNITNANNMTKT